MDNLLLVGMVERTGDVTQQHGDAFDVKRVVLTKHIADAAPTQQVAMEN